jgi:hypothetical protein
VNYDKPDYIEYEIVKGNDSYEVRVDIDKNSNKAAKVDVVMNVWKTESTENALKQTGATIGAFPAKTDFTWQLNLLRLLGPARARGLDSPDRTRRDERSFKPHECRKLVTDDPGVGIRRRASQQRGEDLEPDPEPGFQHVVGCSFPQIAD